MPMILLIIVILALTSGEKSASIEPEQMADCIAEQAYTNPMDDRFKELVNAIAICEEGRNNE